MSEYVIHAVAVTLNAPATVMALHLKMSAPYGHLRAAVYKDNGGKPGGLEFQSEAQYIFSNDVTWVTFEFPDAHLDAGVHWLAFNAEYISDPYARVHYSPAAGSHVFVDYSSGSLPAFPSAFPTPQGSGTNRFLFYADICFDP